MADRDRLPAVVQELILPIRNYPSPKEFAAFRQGAMHRALNRPFLNNPFDPKTRANEWLRWREGWLAQMNYSTAAINEGKPRS